MSILQTITMIQNKYSLGPYRISFQNQGNAWCNHSLLLLFLLFLPMHTRASSLTSQLEEPGMDPANNKSMVIIMAIVAIMFLISGFLSLYSRQCAGHRTLVQARLDLAILTGNPTRRSQPESLGLNQETIDTFPTFLYSSVKGLKIGTCALACAVCLSEFQDEETLRLITKCNHVFHMSCIDVWLVCHSTCPVCRANLAPRQDNVMSPTLSIQIPNYQEQQHSNDEEEENTTVVVGGGEHNSHNGNDAESSKNHLHLLHRSRTVNHVVIAPTRSRSTGLMCALLFPRSNSTGNSVQVGDDDFERFTLRLPVEFQSQVLKKSTLKRAKSCIVFSRMSSGTKGYRTRSVGGGGGMRSYFHYERLDGTTPFFPSNWNR